MIIKFFGKYGSWIESGHTKETGQIRAYALNVGYKEVNEE